MSENQNSSIVTVNNNNENGKGAAMNENIKKLVEEYRELKQQKRDGKTLIYYRGSLIRDNDPVVWEGEYKEIRITDNGLLYGFSYGSWGNTHYYYLGSDILGWDTDECPSEDEWAAMNEVGWWADDDDVGEVKKEINADGSYSVSVFGDWDDTWNAVNAGLIDLYEVDWEALEIDGANLSYGRDHAVKNVVDADKLDLEGEREEYAGKVVEDIGDNINSAKYLDEIGWDEKEDLQAIINAWDEDYYVPNWLLSLCQEKGVNIPATLIENKAEEEEEETAND